ncbi:GL20517 [Drosophila persimilis]|uniref:GL20517 n=1 Tax=Drosophila persimilis TaxID=7234 RepID=B4GJ29_DROPE|nr:GL20517 [Drosophila persimilis]
MTAPECLILADFMYNRSEYTRAAEWYRLTWNNLQLPLNPIAREFYRPNQEEVRKRFLISRLHEGWFNLKRNELILRVIYFLQAPSTI